MRETTFRCAECRQFLGVASYVQQHGAIFLLCSRRGCDTWTPREPAATVGAPIYCGLAVKLPATIMGDMHARGIRTGCGQFLGRIHLTTGTTLRVRCAACSRAQRYEDDHLRGSGRVIVDHAV